MHAHTRPPDGSALRHSRKGAALPFVARRVSPRALRVSSRPITKRSYARTSRAPEASQRNHGRRVARKRSSHRKTRASGVSVGSKVKIVTWQPTAQVTERSVIYRDGNVRPRIEREPAG